MKKASQSRRSKHDPVVHDEPMRNWTVLAQDPSVLAPGGKALTTKVLTPAERLDPGPKGHRIDVIDYDATRNVYYKPRQGDLSKDHFDEVTDIEKLVSDPYFHQQNVYAIAMTTLADFQVALGRPLSWGFNDPSHQLKIAPHAFADANAYYSRESESLCFGYFNSEPDDSANRSRRRARGNGVRGSRPHPRKNADVVFTCLSRDIVAHETAHALLDGLRRFYLRPSHVDQAAFHEAFADVVALLSVLKSAEVVALCLADLSNSAGLIKSRDLSVDSLQKTVFFRLAEQFGGALSFVRGDALRHSVLLKASPKWLGQPEFQEPHRRGEIVVAAIAQSFLKVWHKRLRPRGVERGSPIDLTVVAEEAAKAAGQLLNIAVRAIDYLPPVDMTFPDYLSALLTADLQLYPNDKTYDYRIQLRETFKQFGIAPAIDRGEGAWDPPPHAEKLTYQGLRFEQLQRDPNTLFRFLWENRERLDIDQDAFTRIISIRPCVRISTDGLLLCETVVEYVQTLRVFARELASLGIKRPKDMSGQTFVTLYGGGTLVFDDFGRVKFHIGTGVRSKKQNERLESLHRRGAFSRGAGEQTRFADLHRRRMMGGVRHPEEQW